MIFMKENLVFSKDFGLFLPAVFNGTKTFVSRRNRSLIASDILLTMLRPPAGIRSRYVTS